MRTIIPGEVYQWGDVAPFLGLEHVVNLDIESKRKMLFGRCDIDQYITEIATGSAVLFETYISLDLANTNITHIYFPSFFIKASLEIQNKLGSNRTWPRHRTHSLACAMNQPRYPRIIASCWLANNANDIDFVYTQNWAPDDRIGALYELLQIGGMKDWTGQWGPNLAQLPEVRLGCRHDHDLPTNFEMLYDALFSHAAVAVVIGAVCWERGCEICEPYLFAVLSGCIPVVQGYGVYDRLERLGFDVFDDIIDTTSQWDTNPITAAWNLWEHNKSFFRQAKDIVSDPQIQIRLRHNADLAQDLQKISHNAINALNEVRAQNLWYQHQLWRHQSWIQQPLPWDQWFAAQ
jgi:hypothetical protein